MQEYPLHYDCIHGLRAIALALPPVQELDGSMREDYENGGADSYFADMRKRALQEKRGCSRRSATFIQICKRDFNVFAQQIRAVDHHLHLLSDGIEVGAIVVCGAGMLSTPLPLLMPEGRFVALRTAVL